MLVSAQKSIIEGAQAQLVIQNLHLTKQNEVIQTKENTKEDDLTKLFPRGQGRHLTGDDFHEERVIADKEKRAKAAAKEKRKDDQVTRRARKEAIEKLWKKSCAALRCKGTRLKDLPEKPVRPYKKDIEREVDSAMGLDVADDEDDDDDELEEELQSEEE